ncbi:Interferon-induced very large GTPase 1 [Oryzias melastigma]|uniref:Interferon-induced very large GTPase 1 n=1 Tax=Oryzias melastigma TaxID=30732 RepID=A0A834FM73_ORYME|nr:Interferon-induced very large GTPase 1 [Oryzias melastigma]
MSLKLPRRISSKKKRPPKDNAQEEILRKLGLEAYSTTPLDPASMLDIYTWNLENQAPQELKDLPKVFLQRLWLLNQDARTPCVQPRNDAPNIDFKSAVDMLGGTGEDSQSIINPLDLVISVFMSSNPFLQQEIAVHMMQCQFAVPLVLPNIDPEKSGKFLLWPLRGVTSKWKSHSLETIGRVQEAHLATTDMPTFSCVKLGHLGVSKSQVLNHVLNGHKFSSETFVHRGMNGAQMPRRLSNGLVEIGWYVPCGEAHDVFPVPVAISNLRGNASAHEKCLQLLCKASSVLVVFCGNLQEKEKQLLVTCKEMASKLILIDFSDTEISDNRAAEFVKLPRESVLPASTLREKEVATKLSEMLKEFLPDSLKLVTLEAAATFASELDMNVDEGPACRKAMAAVEEVLKGFDEGSEKFQMKQLPLQGALWSKLSELDKEESKQRKRGNEPDPILQKEKKDVLTSLNNYKMTPAMKIFTDSLFTTDKMERAYFLHWLKLKLYLIQAEKQESLTPLQTNDKDSTSEHTEDSQRCANSSMVDNDSSCTVSSSEDKDKEQSKYTNLQMSEQPNSPVQDSSDSRENTQEQSSEEKESLHTSSERNVQSVELVEKETCLSEQNDQSENQDSADSEQTSNSDSVPLHQSKIASAPTDNSSSSAKQIKHNMSQENCVSSCSETLAPDSLSLGVENFLREMGLIFELTHTGPNSKTQNVLRLPSAAADLLLYGVPLELMDGNASNIPTCWLSCVFAELKRRLPQEQLRTRVLTNIGRHNANHQDFFSTLFGVKFPTRRGMYIAALDVPINLRQELGCDFLFLINVVGLYSSSADNKHNRLMYDNEMATVATAVSDILMLNCSPQNGRQNETPFAVMVNALLRCKEYGSLPIYQLLVQDEGIQSKLQTFQMRRVYNVLKAKNGDKESTNDNNLSTANSATFVKGPQPSMFFLEPVDIHYSTAMLSLKEEMFKALKRCATSKLSALPEFMRDVCAVWEAVKSDSFSIDLQDKDSALAFSLLCTEFSLWEDTLLENMESWLMEATKKIFATNASTLNTDQNDVLSCLNNEAREEIKSEVNKIKLNLEAYLMKDDSLRRNVEMFTEILMSNIANFQDQVTKEIFQKLETVSETHCSSRQMKKFENLLQEEQEFKLLALSETSKSTKILFQDAELEEEFEVVWTKTLSNFDFRPSEADDITFRVREVLKLNLISRGLYKHLKKLDDVGKNQTSDFQINDEHFGYRIRLKHMFEDNNKQQRTEAQQLACKIKEDYNQFVAHKCSLPADFSDSYIEELLENVEKALQEKSMEIRSVFEVDLKIYLCNAACQDFQKLHDRFAKDRELLSYVSETKSKCQAEFIYNFRKRDQCQRIAEAFVSMVIKPTVLDYIYRPLGMHIVEEIKEKSKECQSPQAFHKSLLEELVKEDDFESFKEYLMSYDNFRLKKIQEKVVAYLSESSALGKWRQQKLGEIIGKVAAAVNQTPEVTDGVLSETKPLLEKICLTLEKDAGVYVSRAALNGPLFSITTEWDRFLKHLMELLASIRMDLSQEFSQNVDITQLLHSLSVQPQEYLFNTVRSCDNRCPLCKAPCVEEAPGHGVHKPLLHWPICMLPIDSHSQSCVSCCDNQTPGHNSDAQGMYHACKDLQSLYPNWSNPLDDTNSQNTSNYWRYMLARFNEQLAAQFHQEPAKIPEEWKKITQQEALESLREIVPTREC